MGAIERDLSESLREPKTYGDILNLVERGRKFPDRKDDREFHDELGRIERYVRLFLRLGPQGDPPTPEMLQESLGENNTAMFRMRFQQIGIIT